MARRGGFSNRTLTLRTGTEWDAHTLHIVRVAAPVGITFVGLPVTALGLRAVHAMGHPWLLDLGMGGITVLLTAIMWKISNAKRKGRKAVHIANVAVSMSWLTAAGAADHLFWPLPWMKDGNGTMWTLWFLMVIGGSAAWILLNWRHASDLDDLSLTGHGHGDPDGPRYVDVGYIMRAVAGVPGVRHVTQAATPAFPVLSKLHEQRAIEAPEVIEGAVIDVEDVPEDADRLRLLAAKKAWVDIQRAWKIFTYEKPAGQELRGARLVLVELTPTIVKTKVILRKGEQRRQLVLDARELLAGMLKTEAKKITHVPQQDGSDHEVYLNFSMSTLKSSRKSVVWPGAPTEWSSIGDGPMVYGVYEDGRPASIFMPGDYKKGLVLRHVSIEGTTGAGKSNFARIAVTAGLRQYDVVDWAVDPKKSTQTWGPVAPACDWIMTTMPEAESGLIFINDVVEARFRYLGDNGFSQWEPGCGLPFLRVWCEEGNEILPIFGDDFETIARTARSAGVCLIVSAQSWHHGDIPTPFRDLFADRMQYGVTKDESAFLLDKRLVNAGAAAGWGVELPGKHYWMRADLPIEDQMIPVRAFYAQDDVTLQACRDLAEAKHARVKEEFPDWTKMLKDIDGKNGTYAKRTTGVALRAKIDANIAKREAKKNGTPAPVAPDHEMPIPSPRTSPDPQPYDPTDVDDVIDTPIIENEKDKEVNTASNDHADAGQDKEYDRFTPDNTDDETIMREMSKMGGDASWLKGLGPMPTRSLEDMMPKPDEVLKFGEPPMPDTPHNKVRSLGHLISYLSELGPGTKFTPADVAGECRKVTGKSRQWYREQISSLLLRLGAVEEIGPKGKGNYRVAMRINSPETRAIVDEALAQIPADVMD